MESIDISSKALGITIIPSKKLYNKQIRKLISCLNKYQFLEDWIRGSKVKKINGWSEEILRQNPKSKR